MLDFINSISTTQWILLGLVPPLLVVLTIVFNIVFRRKETVGFVFNGSFWMMIFLFVFLGSFFAQYAVKWLPESWMGRSIFEGNPEAAPLFYGLFFITLGYFLCYALISFRPVTQLQMDTAKANKQLALDFSGTTAARAAAKGIGSFLFILIEVLSSLLTAILASIFTILCGFAGAILVGVIILPILGVLAIAVTMFFMFCSILIAWAICIFKFIKNMFIVAMGPAKVSYNPKPVMDV